MHVYIICFKQTLIYERKPILRELLVQTDYDVNPVTLLMGYNIIS